MLKILMVLCLGMVAAFAIGCAFAADPASRTFTYTSETEPKPGQKTKVREVIKVIDSSHYNLE